LSGSVSGRLPQNPCGTAVAKGAKRTFAPLPEIEWSKFEKQKQSTKHQTMKRNRKILATLFSSMLALAVAFSVGILPQPSLASGGSGGGGGGGGSTSSGDTIKVSKCYYFDTGSYVEMLINASSSDSTAHLYAYLPSGQYLGEVQNGGGGRYGGTVFLTFGIPSYITIISSSGGRIDAPTSPMQL
jgi:hypothetical protein